MGMPHAESPGYIFLLAGIMGVALAAATAGRASLLVVEFLGGFFAVFVILGILQFLGYGNLDRRYDPDRQDRIKPKSTGTMPELDTRICDKCGQPTSIDLPTCQHCGASLTDA